MHASIHPCIYHRLLSIYPSIHPSVCLPIHPSLYLSPLINYPSTYLSTYLSIHPSFHCVSVIYLYLPSISPSIDLYISSFYRLWSSHVASSQLMVVGGPGLLRFWAPPGKSLLLFKWPKCKTEEKKAQRCTCAGRKCQGRL